MFFFRKLHFVNLRGPILTNIGFTSMLSLFFNLDKMTGSEHPCWPLGNGDWMTKTCDACCGYECCTTG